MSKNEKEFVIIQSKVNIRVVPGLQHEDVTNADAHVPDRLKVSALWPKMAILLHEGVGTYPSYITEWNTVKALVKDEIITIGGFTDNANEQQIQEKAKLDMEIKEAEDKMKMRAPKVETQTTSLNDIAGE